jgi:hypothetical protein
MEQLHMDRLPIDEEQLDGLLVLEPRSVYDPCIIGTVERFHDRFVLYSKSKVLEAVVAGIPTEGPEDYDPYSEALEHYYFNIAGAFVGEQTPGFLEDEPAL